MNCEAMNTDSELGESRDKSFSKIFEGIVKATLVFLVQYFRTFGFLLVKPHRVASKLIRAQPRIKAYVPPLTFLSVSALLFVIATEFLGRRYFNASGPQELFRVINE